MNIVENREGLSGSLLVGIVSWLTRGSVPSCVNPGAPGDRSANGRLSPGPGTTESYPTEYIRTSAVRPGQVRVDLQIRGEPGGIPGFSSLGLLRVYYGVTPRLVYLRKAGDLAR